MVKYSNISVLLTDDFMDAVQSDSDFDLHGVEKHIQLSRPKSCG